AFMDRRRRPFAVNAAYDTGLANLRCPGHRVRCEVGAAQDGPLQTGSAYRVLDRPECVGEPLIATAVLHSHSRERDHSPRAVISRELQQFDARHPGRGITERAWADEYSFYTAQRRRQRCRL